MAHIAEQLDLIEELIHETEVIVVLFKDEKGEVLIGAMEGPVESIDWTFNPVALDQVDTLGEAEASS